MYILHKIVANLVNPLMIGIFLVVAAMALAWFRKRRGALLCMGAAIGWLWIFATPWMRGVLGARALRDYPPVAVEALPEADAIVVLGGGILSATNGLAYADLQAGADRVWHAARLWKAGKAPLVVPTGTGETGAAAPLLGDLGVAPEAVRVEANARNTRENAQLVAEMLGETEAPTILLVTSAWHMERSLAEFRKAMPKARIVPAPTDYDMLDVGSRSQLRFWPSAFGLSDNSALFKERLGLLGARLRR